MWTVPRIGEYMGSVDEALENKFLMKTLGLESISGSMRKLLGLGANMEGLRIPNPTEMADKNHRTSQACREHQVDSLITGKAFSISKHRDCVYRSIRDRQEIK